MASKQDIQELKERRKDITHIFIPHLSNEEEDKEENGELFHTSTEIIQKQLENQKFESMKFDD